MRKILLDEKKNYYKGNMHCHSTQSDGAFTPLELKNIYKEKGYSFLALTDHEVLYDNSYLDDEDFISITSTEYAIKEFPSESTLINFDMKVCHLNLYAKDQHNTNSFCYNSILDHYSSASVREENVKKFGHHERPYSAKGINQLIKTANENGFFVTYNHPKWSLENYKQYSKYKGLWALEVCNGSALNCHGSFEYNIDVYDDMLKDGKKLFISSGDDNHNEGKSLKDSFGTFIMVNAKSLTYENIINALLKGKFYSSQGPTITSLVLDGNKVKIKCSNAKQIFLSTSNRYTQRALAKEGEFVNEAEFVLHKSTKYFRLDVVDEYNRRANTQAYHVKF